MEFDEFSWGQLGSLATKIEEQENQEDVGKVLHKISISKIASDGLQIGKDVLIAKTTSFPNKKVTWWQLQCVRLQVWINTTFCCCGLFWLCGLRRKSRKNVKQEEEKNDIPCCDKIRNNSVYWCCAAMFQNECKF